jgi:hypothetical protein
MTAHPELLVSLAALPGLDATGLRLLSSVSGGRHESLSLLGQHPSARPRGLGAPSPLAVPGVPMMKITFQCTREVHKRFLVLEHQTGSADTAELIRKAMAVFEIAVQARQAGGRLLVENADGTSAEVDLSLIPREAP